MSLHIETVSVELLRAGPRHNQLVSPLTQYLAVCGNAPAGRVSLRYEHGEIERLLQELRYKVEDPDDARRAGKVLDQLGIVHALYPRWTGPSSTSGEFREQA